MGEGRFVVSAVHAAGPFALVPNPSAPRESSELVVVRVIQTGERFVKVEPVDTDPERPTQWNMSSRGLWDFASAEEARETLEELKAAAAPAAAIWRTPFDVPADPQTANAEAPRA